MVEFWNSNCNVPFILHLEKYVYFLHLQYFEFNVRKVKSGVHVLAEVYHHHII